jgi:PmbA protein
MAPLDLAQRLLDAARAAGAEAADALVGRSSQVSIEVRGGRLEEAQRAEGIDLGLRVLVGQKQAVVAASKADDATLAAMAERAVAMAREAPEDPSVGLAEPADLAGEREMGRLEIAEEAPEPDPALLEAEARAAEAAALEVPGVTQVESAGAGWSRREMALAASNGFSGGYARTAGRSPAGRSAGPGRGWSGTGTGTAASSRASCARPRRSGAPPANGPPPGRGRASRPPGASRSSTTSAWPPR